jgi:hypothetical protein
MLADTFPFKQCDRCRATRRRYEHGDVFKAIRRAWNNSESGKASAKMTSRGEKVKANQRRYRLSEKGKATDKRQSSKLSSKLGASLRRMVRGINQNPASLPSLGVFAENRDVQEHFVSTFEPWMTLENQGVHRRGDDYNTKWHIGHRIPRAVFNNANIEDVRRCWSRENVYAQCARANVENWKKLTLTDAELLRLRSVWPTAAKDLQGLKVLF